MANEGLERALAAALDAAKGALTRGEYEDAERGARAISSLVKAAREARDLAVAAAADARENDVEELRAELRRRLALFVEADVSGAPAEVLERIAMEGGAG